eukprot:508435_1
MSHKKQHSKFNGQSADLVLKHCPNYEKYDKRARMEAKTRIIQHLSERRDGVKRCVDIAVEEFKKLDIFINLYAPIFIDDDEIINNAAQRTNIEIDKWGGVQIKHCKKSRGYNRSTIVIDTYKEFEKKAKNHQDQTSWKISGDYFFAPYIKKTRIFLMEYCTHIPNIPKDIMTEIFNLLCLSFANALFQEKIKFKHSKLKPLIRHRTLVKSKGIHSELQALYPAFTVSEFIKTAKAKRKMICGKTDIIACDFFQNFQTVVNQLYLKQKTKVYKLLNNSNNSN